MAALCNYVLVINCCCCCFKSGRNSKTRKPGKLAKASKMPIHFPYPLSLLYCAAPVAYIMNMRGKKISASKALHPLSTTTTSCVGIKVVKTTGSINPKSVSTSERMMRVIPFRCDPVLLMTFPPVKCCPGECATFA